MNKIKYNIFLVIIFVVLLTLMAVVQTYALFETNAGADTDFDIGEWVILVNNVDITLENAMEALKDIIYPDKSKVITPQLIIDTVCEQYGTKKEEIFSKKRNSEIVLPRQVIMYLCREHTDASLEEIGKLLGKKDHTTVMSGINKIKKQIAFDEELNKNLDIIMKKLNPSL